jgi:hypothetical protein
VAVSGLTLDAVQARRRLPEPTAQVMFQIKGLYGFNCEGAKVPLANGRSLDSGPISLTLDPDAPASSNIGIVDFARKRLRVRYAVQLVFPGLYDLVKSRAYDLSLLHPVRGIATDECEVAEDYSGWRALGRLDFLPGSMWSGAGGG